MTKRTRQDRRPPLLSPIPRAGGRGTRESAVAGDSPGPRKVERRKERLLTQLRNDVQSALAALLDYIDLVLRDDAGRATGAHLELLTSAARDGERLVSLSNHVLDLEKLQAGDIRLCRERLDLGIGLRSVASALRPQAQHRGLELVEEIAGSLVVVGDPQRLLQVFSSLASNVIESSTAGEVALRASRVEGQVEVVIQGTGRRQPGGDLRRLFSELVRNPDGAVLDAGCAGFGLFIAERMVELHGGSLRVEDQGREGTRFRILLPEAVESETFPEVEEEQEAPAMPVYVLDAERGVGDRLRQTLRREACSVRQVWNLAEARKLRVTGPAVILLNREFAGGEARELARAWRRDPASREAAIILFWKWPPTADPADQVIVFRVAGGNRTEVSEADLTAQVRDLIRGFRTTQESFS